MNPVRVSEQYAVGAVGQDFEFRFVDKVAVKGRKEAVRVYELLGARGECNDRKELVTAYERALEAYLRRDFRGALDELQPIADDGPSRTLIERCKWMLKHPPAAEWDGVYVATSK